MKVVLLHRDGELAGSQRHVVDLAGVLAKSPGVRLEVIVPSTTRELQPFAKALLRAGAPVEMLPGSDDAIVRALTGLRTLRVADVVHSHLPVAEAFAVAATMGATTRRIVTAHNLHLYRRRDLRARVAQTLLRRAHGVICVSGAVKGVALDALGERSTPVQVIHHGVDLTRLRSVEESGEVARIVDGDQPTIAVVAAFRPGKGHDLALSVADRLPDVRILFAGDGPLREATQRVASRRHVFVGAVERVGSVYGAVDAVLIPTSPELDEGFSLVFAEALLSDRPVIAPATATFRELLEALRSTVPDVAPMVALYRAGDAESGAKATRRILGSVPRLSADSRARLEERFSVTAMANATLDFYGFVLGRDTQYAPSA